MNCAPFPFGIFDDYFLKKIYLYEETQLYLDPDNLKQSQPNDACFPFLPNLSKFTRVGS
jgi:hypothetical protein